MNSVLEIQNYFISYLSKKFNIDPSDLTKADLELNTDPLKQNFGDLSSNAPLIIAKLSKKAPRQIGQEIIETFTHPAIAKIEIAGPGFLNIFLTNKTFINCAQELFSQRDKFFKADSDFHKEKINIEFISANPTGPLHFGHGRGGIIGDVLGKLLHFLGHTVTKEYYINDAGSQIKKLTTSLIIRCQQILGIEAQLPEEGYHGYYLQELAQKCINEYGPSVLEKSEQFFEDYATEHLLKNIKNTLVAYGITFDVWFSEKQLHTSGAIQQTVELLRRKGFLYEKESAWWFKSTEFGDDKDRVVRKASGEWTYVAADIAYIKNKTDRGFNRLIMVLGHDHHSYAVRLETIRQALELKVPLNVILYQLVKIKSGQQEMRMSKRSGHMITLQDVINTVGMDVARFFYLHRKADAQLDFDLELALRKTEENPVYYVQYAYVRTKSILCRANDYPTLQGITAEDIHDLGPQEALLLKKIMSLKSLLATIALNHQTHLLTYYSIELANSFHTYYSHNRIVDPENVAKSRARLLLIIIVRNTFITLFDLLGISKPEKM